MLCERHAWLSLFLTRDYAESTRKDDEILENNGKKLKEDPLLFLLSGKGSPGKSGLDFSMTWRLRLERATQKLLKVLVLEKKKKPFMTTMKTQTIRRNPSGNCVILFFSGQKPCIPFEPTHYNIGFSRPRISLI